MRARDASGQISASGRLSVRTSGPSSSRISTPTSIVTARPRPAEERARGDVEERDRREQCCCDLRLEDSDDSCPRVHRYSGTIAARDPVHLAPVGVGPQQPAASADRVAPHEVEEDRGRGERDPVRDRRRAPVTGPDVGREQSRRERNEGDAEQEEDVDEEEDAVDAAELPQDRVVVHPDDPDGEEADRVADVGGPEPDKLVREAVLAELGNLDVQDEQRRGDREHAVGERLQPGGRHLKERLEPDRQTRRQRAQPLEREQHPGT